MKHALSNKMAAAILSQKASFTASQGQEYAKSITSEVEDALTVDQLTDVLNAVHRAHEDGYWLARRQLS